MLSKFIVQATVVAGLVVGALACSGGSSAQDPSAAGNDQAVTEGHTCGGIAGIQCKAGYVCKLSSSHPDASGTCTKAKAGEEGATCGGIAGLRCNRGLECVIAASDENGAPVMGMPSPDASGTCQRKIPDPGTEGGICAGVAGIACEAGLSCVIDSANGAPVMGMPSPDALGHCEKDSSGGGPPPGAMGMPAPEH